MTSAGLVVVAKVLDERLETLDVDPGRTLEELEVTISLGGDTAVAKAASCCGEFGSRKAGSKSALGHCFEFVAQGLDLQHPMNVLDPEAH